MYSQSEREITIEICPGECTDIGLENEDAYCVSWEGPEGSNLEVNSNIINVCPSLEDEYNSTVQDENGDIVERLTYSFKLPNMTVSSVELHSPTESPGDQDWIIVKKDPTRNSDPDILINEGDVISGISSTVAYSRENSSNLEISPIVYVSGVTGKVSAKLKTTCTSQVRIKAIGPDGFDLPWVDVTPVDGYATYPVTELELEFTEEKALYYEEFSFKWYVSFDENEQGDGVEVGETMFPLYVLYKQPDLTVAFPPYEYSLIDVACRNAHNVDDKSELLKSIYSEFLDREVAKVNSNIPMKYWGDQIPDQSGSPPDPNLCFSYQALLAWSNATCGAWADFLYNCFAVQGIEDLPKPTGVFSEIGTTGPWAGLGRIVLESNINSLPSDQLYLQRMIAQRDELLEGMNTQGIIFQFGVFRYSIESQNGTEVGTSIDEFFLVKKWNTGELSNGTGFMMSELYVPSAISNNAPLPGTPNFIPPEDIKLMNGRVIPYIGLQGIGGQGHKDPRAEFENHAIYVYEGKIYDPSYGSPVYNSQKAWEKGSLTGYGIQTLVQLPASATTTGTMTIRRTMLIDQLERDPIQTHFYTPN